MRTKVATNGNRQIFRGVQDAVLAAYAIFMGAIGDVTTTLVTLAIMLPLYFSIAPALFEWATLTTGTIYLCLLIMRLVRRNVMTCTLDELGDRLADIEEKLDIVVRNV